MSASRDALWYVMHDRTGEIRELDRELDRLDWEVDFLRRQQHEETRDRLQRLGVDTTNYRPLPARHPNERRCQAHPPEDIEQLVIEAKMSPLDRAWAERGEIIHHPPNSLIRRRFETEITIR